MTPPAITPYQNKEISYSIYFDGGKFSHFKKDESGCDGTVNGVSCQNNCEQRC